jgi:hypothetical protein
MNRFRKFGWLFLFAAFLIAAQALTVQPQLSPDEQSVIVNAVVQTINPEVLAASIAQTVEAKVMANLGAAPVATMTMTPEPAAVNGTAPSVTPESYVGLHAKFVNSYAYTVGGDSGTEKTFETEYTPNTLFTFDVVFENDGTFNWPPLVEMRNTGSVSTYTGHRPNVIVDTSSNPVEPGERQGFSISAHGSEELGYHTFYFQLFDAQSGVPIPGGYGYFSYLAK